MAKFESTTGGRRIERVMEWTHLWSGLVAAPLLLMLGLTGSVLTFEYPLDHVLHRRLAYVEPRGERLPLDVLLADVRRAEPTAKVVVFSLSPSSAARDMAYTATVQRPGTEVASTVYIDPYDGRILGRVDGPTFTTRVHDLHTSLLAGDKGAFVLMLMSVLLIVLSGSGLVLWWPRKIVSVRWSASGRRITFDLHNAVGMYAFVFMLIFGVTGVVIHWQSKWLPAANAALHLADTEPEVKAAARVAGAGFVSLDALERTAAVALPGGRVTQVNMPSKPGVYRVWVKFPEDGTPLGRSYVLVDAGTGAVLYTRSARTVGVPTRFFREWNREVHTGDVFGWPTRILMCGMSLALPVLAVTGPLFWWRRKRRRPAVRAAVATGANAG